ncbi:PilZ domain-containing protein [Agrobacterium rubi]|nr:PilZ domain-containing protein [Agrobacterium rubi]NTF24914.1 PilZ domain-containing protein [Agrobacterium rubi]
MRHPLKETGSRLSPTERRRSQRQRFNVAVEIQYQGRSVPGRIFDLSTSGMQVVAERILIPAIGSSIIVKSHEIGTIEGVVRRCWDGRIGMQFDGNTASVAQMNAYFRFFHRSSK